MTECQPKYIPLITQTIPNQNKSHLKCYPCLDGPALDCVDPNCGNTADLKGFPVSGPHNEQCNSCYDVQTGHQRQCECQKCICKRSAVLEEECPQHVEGNRWQDLRRKSRDPAIQQIRDKLSSSEGVRQNLRWCPDDEWLTCVDRKFRQAQRGYLGQAWVHYGAAQDCDFPKKMLHGVVGSPTSAHDLIRPPLKNWVEQLDQDLNESVYESNRLYPLGKSHDQLPNLPLKVDPETTIFGDPSKKDQSAGELVNPPKDRRQIEREDNCCRQLYRMTHGSFNPGEQLCRNYVGGFRRTNTFGMKTPNDVAGRWSKKIIGTWRSCEADPPYVSKIYADHLDQRYAKLGMAQDRVCIRKDHGDCFTYGKKSELERERPIREIIFNRCPNEGATKSMKMMHDLKDWLTKVRKNFKLDHGADFESFYEDLIANDADCNGTIEWDPFMKVLINNHIPRTLETEDFMGALAAVNVFHPSPCNKINFYLLMDLIKGHEDPKFLCKTTTLKPYYMPHANSCIHFRTTYSDLTSNMCVPQSCIQYNKEQRIYGMPSVRQDRTPTKIRSTKDFTNYGDDGDAYSLIWPSVYTTRGVTARDAFRVLSKDEMMKIFCKSGVEISHAEFDAVWELAKEKDPEKNGRTSFQTFREALCQHRSGPEAFVSFPPEVRITDCCHEQMNSSCINHKKGKPNPCAGVDP